MTLTSIATDRTYAGAAPTGEVVAIRRAAAGRRSRRPRTVPRAVPLADAAAVLLVGGLAVTLSPRDLAPVALTGTAWAAGLVAAGGWARRPRPATSPLLVATATAAVVAWTAGAAGLTPVTPVEVLLTLALAVLAASVRALPTASGPATRVVVAGDVDGTGRLVAELRRAPRAWSVAAVCLDQGDVDDVVGIGPGWRDLPVHVGVDRVVATAVACHAGAVVLVPGRSLDPAGVRRVTWGAHDAGLEVLVATGLLDVRPGRLRHVPAGAAALARVAPRTIPTVSRSAKHVLDRVLAAGVVLVLLPLLLLIALAIRWESPGGALFRQRRVGRDGSSFTMYKFRTMHADAEAQRRHLGDLNEADGALFKVRDDPRVTRVGRVLRRYSLDELPQLVNVLRGEMSLIGPRPALPDEVASYDEDPRRRLAVRPGLTGLWQVSGRSDLDWEESVRLDLHYVDNWSWALDLRILLRTVGAVVGHRGAY